MPHRGTTRRAAGDAVIQADPRQRTRAFDSPPFPVAKGSRLELTGLLVKGGVKTLRIFDADGKTELTFQLGKHASITEESEVTVSTGFDQATAAQYTGPAFERITVLFERERCRDRE